MANTNSSANTIEGNGNAGTSKMPSRRGVSTPSTQEAVQCGKRKIVVANLLVLSGSLPLMFQSSLNGNAIIVGSQNLVVPLV